MATKTKAEKAAALMCHAASLVECVDALASESLQIIDSSTDTESNRGSLLIFAARALVRQVGWMCDLASETLEQEFQVTKGDAKEWMLPPSCHD